jgi:hypothetical protein
MTCIVAARTDEMIALSSDGALVDSKTLNLLANCSKVVLMPECSCIIAQRGAGGMLQALRWRLGVPFDFDDILQHIVGITREINVDIVREYTFERQWSLVIGGWSDSRERFELYSLRSRDFEMPNGLSGGVDTIPAFTLYPIDGFIASPMPTSEQLLPFGVDWNNLTMDAISLTQRVACATRGMPEAAQNTGAELSGFMIGGFLQTTVLYRDHITSSIVHRWPDVIGEKIDPTRGEQRPPWLA